ncbi:MAG: LytTR family DNA-binding domain-containing protein [Bacteroidota bacterium]
MKILLIEDEKWARQSLEQLILAIRPKTEIVGQLESVQESVAWLKSNQADLIFLDIHLADALSFDIFKQVKVTTPIIFTTAYDQYALQAFKVNSIDYLLKPIEEEELKLAIEKFEERNNTQTADYEQLIATIEELKGQHYQERFMISRGEKIMSATIDQIAYFEGEDRYVYLTKKDGSRYIIDYRLSDLEKVLHPKQFFRLNRSFIVHFDSIDRIITLSKSRLKVELKPTARRDIYISAANNRDFKAWLNG